MKYCNFAIFNRVVDIKTSFIQIRSTVLNVGRLKKESKPIILFSSPELKAHRGAYRIGRGPSASSASSSTISKKNISEASGLILIKFDVNHHWIGGLIALGFGADCIKIVVSIASDSSHRLAMVKTKKKIFSETTRPTALIFGMWQWLMVLFKHCAIHAPGVKFGLAPGVSSLHRLTTGNIKTSISPKPVGGS